MPGEEDNQYIPIVDLGEIGVVSEKEPSESEWQRVGKEIVDAFANVGFVYFKGHGIPDDHVANLMKAGKTFFDLPESEKKQHARNDAMNHGYVPLNEQRLDLKYKYELRESYDIRRSDQPFPDDKVPQLKPAATKFLDACTRLTRRLLVAMAIGLGIDRNYFLKGHDLLLREGNHSCAKLNNYPPVPKDTATDTIRFGAHTDFGNLALLFQDYAGGLQVRGRNGKWVNATHIPGTCVVNAGDLLQFWTLGKLKATEHRVIVPAEDAGTQKWRQSLVFFILPDDDFLIQPLDGSSAFEPVKSWDYIGKRLKDTYNY